MYASRRAGTMDLYLTDRTGTIVHRLTDAVFSETGPTWGPDGSEIAFVGTYDGVAELWAIQPDGGGLRKIIGQPDVTIPSGPAWSPDGQYIVFSARTDEPTGSEIYLVRADGTGLTRLTYSQGFDYEPKWSPDGRQIAFTTARTGINSLGLMNFDGSDQEVLTQSAFYPTWLPDGSAILYQGYDAGFDLYTYRLDNGTITKLTDTPTLEEGYPAVAPDGSVAIFESLRGDSTLFDLWQIDLSSGELKQLTFSTDDTGAAWAPRSQGNCRYSTAAHTDRGRASCHGRAADDHPLTDTGADPDAHRRPNRRERRIYGNRHAAAVDLQQSAADRDRDQCDQRAACRVGRHDRRSVVQGSTARP
ncbi:MAG: hypothetical protein HND48_12555 [Chloroflexi bacterium]|nr:hypothetical protein [Chloroflexota bacterium]